MTWSEVSEPITWTCQICGEERDDRDISVSKLRRELPGSSGAEVGVNVRYCNDNPVCAEAAPVKAEAMMDAFWHNPQ